MRCADDQAIRLRHPREHGAVLFGERNGETAAAIVMLQRCAEVILTPVVLAQWRLQAGGQPWLSRRLDAEHPLYRRQHGFQGHQHPLG